MIYLSPGPGPYRSKSFGLWSTFFTIHFRTVRSVALFAVFGCAAVYTHDPAVDFLLLLVTLRASHHAVRAVQRIIGLTVIEGGSAPLCNGVASGTIFLVTRRHELTAMNIFVAFEALLGSVGEIG